jgi:hypothetical protein
MKEATKEASLRASKTPQGIPTAATLAAPSVRADASDPEKDGLPKNLAWQRDKKDK